MRESFIVCEPLRNKLNDEEVKLKHTISEELLSLPVTPHRGDLVDSTVILFLFIVGTLDQWSPTGCRTFAAWGAFGNVWECFDDHC